MCFCIGFMCLCEFVRRFHKFLCLCARCLCCNARMLRACVCSFHVLVLFLLFIWPCVCRVHACESGSTVWLNECVNTKLNGYRYFWQYWFAIFSVIGLTLEEVCCNPTFIDVPQEVRKISNFKGGDFRIWLSNVIFLGILILDILSR